MIQNIIDLIRCKKVLSLSLQENLFYDAHYRDIYNGYTLYYLKFKSLENKLSGIKNLILGNSHGVYGFLPNNNEFNLCLPSQDLYYALKLYEKYRFKCHNLRTIYLFYSVFSPGFEIAESNEKWRCTWYQMFFNIKSQNKSVNILSNLLLKRLKNKINKECLNMEIPLNYNGENIDLKGVGTFKYYKNYTAKKRALDHFKNNVRSNNSHKYLIELAKLVKDDGRTLYVVIPPMHEDFKKWLTSDKILFNELYNLSISEKFEILNFYSNKAFVNEDFFDFDHLNSVGANKLTDLIHKYTSDSM